MTKRKKYLADRDRLVWLRTKADPVAHEVRKQRQRDYYRRLTAEQKKRIVQDRQDKIRFMRENDPEAYAAYREKINARRRAANARKREERESQVRMTTADLLKGIV